MTAIKYNGNKKSIINRYFDESIENLDAAVSCFNGIAIPSDLSDINNLITQLSGSRRIITVHKEGFSRACQALNDKELEMASNIGGLEYFNINKFTYSSGRVNTVSIFDGADLSFLSKYMSEEKWADYYGDTIDELTKKKEDLSDLVNRTISEKELNELKKKYPYLKFEYDKKTGKARILTPEEVQKRIDASNNKGSVGNVVTPDMARYKAEYEKWFEGRYKRSYSNYKNEISRIEQDILLLDSAKHDLEQIIKLKEYDVIKDSNDYKNYNQNYYRNHHGVNVNEEIRKYANVGYDDLVTGTKQYANTTLRDVMKYMNEDQKKMYCYLYNSKGRDEANKYLEALEDGINRTKGMEKYNQFVEKIAKRDSRGNIVTEKTRDRYGNTVEQVVFDTRLFSGNYIDTTLAGLGMGIKNFGEGFENLFSNKGTISSNQYAQMYIMNGLYNAKESGQSVEALTGTLEMAINTGNMLPSIALSTMLTFLCPPAAAGGVAIGNIAGSSLMGLSAAGNAKNQAYLSGANDAQANIYGALNGLSETTLGYFLGRIPGLSGASRGFLGDIASEGFEEFSQEYVDAALRAGILGEKIDFNQLSADATKSFLMGAASSGIMNVGMHPINSAMMNRNVSVMANQIATERGLGKESIPAIEKLLREQIKLAEEQNSNLGNNGNSPKVIPISSTANQSSFTEQTGVKEGKVISFNDATKNNNTSPKKAYTPPKAEIGGIALEEEVANNSAIPNSPKNSAFSNIGQKIKGMFSGKNGDVINNSIEQQSNKHTIDPEHGFQLNRSDFGTLINMVNYYESSDSFKNFGNDMLSQVNTKGYMSEYTGNYLTELVNGGEYDVYVKHILSENLDSINEDGVYCNGRGLSVGMNNVPKSISDVDLTATVYKIDNVYNAVGAIKNVSSGRSEGGNPINGALIIKVPKGTPMENILYWNETSGCFCIDPKYNDSYIVVDRNCNVSEPSFIDHEVTVLDTDTYNNVEDNSVYSELLEDINLIIKAHDKKYGEGSTIAALKAFCDPNSNNYLNYDLITSSDGARALLQEYTPKHIQKALELLSSQNKTIEMSKSSNNNANNQKTNNAQFEEYKRELKVMTTPEFAEFVKEYHSGNALVIAGEQRQDFLNIYTNFKNLVGSLRNSGTLTSSEIDFLNIIEGHASKYGYADAIERLSRMSDPNDVNYGRYELISSNGNARNFLSKYSLEQIRNNLINLGLVNDVVAPISDNIQNSDVVNNLNDNSNNQANEHGNNTKDSSNSISDNSSYSELVADVLSIIKTHDNIYGEGSTIAALKAFCDPNSNNYLNYDLITSSDGARALLQEYTPKHIEKAIELLSNDNNNEQDNTNNYALNHARSFFDYDLKVKDLINDCSSLGRAEILGKIDEIDSYFYRMTKGTELEDAYPIIERKINDIKNQILNCSLSELGKIREKYIYGLSTEAVNTIEENFFGYSIEYSFEKGLKDCRSLNELLHAIHHASINMTDSNAEPILMKNVQQLHTSKDYYGHVIKVFGVDSSLINNIYSGLNNIVKADGDIHMLSLNDKVIIMARGSGHALTIEITQLSNGQVEVSYNVPKITNYNMIYNLRGFTSIVGTSPYDGAVGGFITNMDNLGSEICNFIESVPTDADNMRGLYDQEQSNNTSIISSDTQIADVIPVSQLDMSFKRTNLLSKGEYNINQSYEEFDYIVRPKASLDSTIAEIINNNDGSNILIDIANANELTEELVSNIPDNVSIRISNYNDNYYRTFDNANDSSNGTLRHLTYSALELREIMDKIKTIENGIDSSWNDYQKAKYIYEYLRDNITYHSREDMHKILPPEQRGNANRPKHYDGLMSLVDGVSTCQGFAHTYKILLDRLGMECIEVWGQLDGEGQHAYNIVTIDGNTFIVDTTRESLERNAKEKNNPGKYEGIGFGVQNISQYNAKSDRNILSLVNCNINDLYSKLLDNYQQFTPEQYRKVIDSVRDLYDEIFKDGGHLSHELIVDLKTSDRSIRAVYYRYNQLVEEYKVFIDDIIKRHTDEGLSYEEITKAPALEDFFSKYERLLEIKSKTDQYVSRNKLAQYLINLSQDEYDWLCSYSGSGFVNEKLRKDLPLPDKYHEIFLPTLDNAIANFTLPSDMILYRAISYKYYASIFSNLGIKSVDELSNLVGKTMVDKGYSSTSLRTTGAGPSSRSSGNSIVIQIYAKKGQHAFNYSELCLIPAEEEVLLPRNTTYEFFDYEEIDGMKILKAYIY